MCPMTHRPEPLFNITYRIYNTYNKCYLILHYNRFYSFRTSACVFLAPRSAAPDGTDGSGGWTSAGQRADSGPGAEGGPDTYA